MNRYEFPKGDLNPAKRPEVRKKISKALMGPKNPMWKPKVKLICQVCSKSFEVTPCCSNQKTCSRKCQGKLASIRMKKNNPMYRKDSVKKMAKTYKRKIKEGKIIPWMCTPEGRTVISVIAKDKSLNDNPMNKYKGMTWEEMFGIEEAKQKRILASKKFEGKNNPMYGKVPCHPKPYFVPKLKHKVRSLWEETFCLWLKKNKISYEYEPEKFLISVDNKKTHYWPDVRIFNNVYCEIKSSYILRKQGINKLKSFVGQHNKKLFLITDEEPQNIENIEFVPFDENVWEEVFYR